MSPKIPLEKITTFAEGLDHPEGLAFDRNGHLWAGGEAGQVYRISPDGTVEEITKLEGFCAGLAFSPSDELFLCHAAQGVVVHVTPSGKHSVFAAHAGSHKIVCPNYPVFDRAGNLYVSDSGDWQKQNGYLLCFAPDGKGQVIGGPYGYANGLALSADERTLFMIETDTNRVYRFESHSDGALGSGETYVDGVGRAPDGLALDVEGNLYVCCYASDDIHCISPSRERTLVAHDPFGILLGGPTNMAFGGPNRDELYVANLSRFGITRFPVAHRGQPLANQGVGGGSAR